MSIDWGSVPANSVLPFIFTSHDAATGANETMSALALADIIIYKGVSLTQRSSTAGFAFFGADADGLDLDTFTGVNGVSIDTSDNTDAGFYAAGSFYTVVLGPVTIDAQTVYTVLGTFRLMAAEGVAGVPDVNVTHVADTAQTAGDLKGSLNTIDDFIDTEIGAIQTTLGTPAGASVSADIAAIEAQTDDIGAAGAGLTAVPWNAAWDAEVQSEVDDALVAQRLDELLNADSDIDGAAPPTVGSVFHEVMSKTAGSFTFDQTTDSLEAVRDKAIDIETDTQDIQSKVGTPAGASVSADVAAVKSDTAAILVDTGTTLDGRIPAALVSGRMDASVGAMAANVLTAAAIATDAIDADAVAADAVTEIQSGLSTLTAAGIRTAVGLAAANLDTQLGDLPTAIENADALLKRDIDNVEATAAVHSLCSALLKLVSKFEASTGKTYRTDGTTTHMTQTVTTDDSADPITTIGVAV